MGASLVVTVPEPSEIPEKDRKSCMISIDLPGVIRLIQGGKAKRIACLCGAGISVSAGIPDFRSPGTGLYSRLQEYDLPTPESIFALDYFRERPAAFCTLAREMFPGRHQPTATHAFIRLLQDKGLLLRCYTQNIDNLERLAGIAPEMLVEAHGSFADAHCIDCGAQFSLRHYRDCVDGGGIPRCGCILDVAPPQLPPSDLALDEARRQLEEAKEMKEAALKSFVWDQMVKSGVAESKAARMVEELENAASAYPEQLAAWEAAPKTRTCGGLVKADIVFFGEATRMGTGDDLAQADLLIVMGTSLQVMPFAGLIGKVPALCPRLLINRDLVGHLDQPDPPAWFGNVGFRFSRDDNYRDVFLPAACDDGVIEICAKLGWSHELHALLSSFPVAEAWEELAASQKLGPNCGTVMPQQDVH